MDKASSEDLSVERLPGFGNVVHGAEMDAADGSFFSWQLDDLEAVAGGSGVGVAGNDLQAIFNRLVQRDGRLQSSAFTADHLGNGVKGGTYDTGDRRLVCYDGSAGCEADRGQRLLNDLDLGHVVLFLDEVEPPLYVHESASSDAVFLLNLCAANPQQSSDAIGPDTLVKDRRNIIEAEAELAECNDSMQTLKLRGIIRPVAAELVNVGWHEQTGGVPMPQHPMGYLPDLRESSDG